MTPNGKEYNPAAQYFAELYYSTGLEKDELAKVLHVDERTIYRWLSGERQFPYSIQFCLECIVLEP